VARPMEKLVRSWGFEIAGRSERQYPRHPERTAAPSASLLNRIDEVIVFHKLTREEILVIVDIQMKRVREQMATHDVAIELTDEAKELLVEKGYDPSMGARPLRRAIQRVIEDPLADFVLGRTLEPGSTILVSRKGETEEVDMTVIPGEVTPEKVTVPPEEPSDSAVDEPEPVKE